MRLKDKVALVTGTSPNIGGGIVEGLAAEGAAIVAVDFVEANAADCARYVAGSGGRALGLACDVNDEAQVKATVAAGLEAFGRIDILVNNAAVAARLATVDTGAVLIDEILAVNVRAPLLLIAAVVPSMVAARRGVIVNLSSVSGVVGTPRRTAYAASKGALDAATRSLAIELGPSGIRVNSVAPGVVDTDLWAKNKAIPGVVETIEAQTPLRRWAQPDDIADVIAFLCSDGARFITGETISVDGGLARTLDLYGGAV
jgi:NAD(P)-dependent dehydrogenase (short-subunit alcohol dehydrogenase family)